MSPDYAAYNEAMAKAGIMLGGERLRPTSTAASVRVTVRNTLVLVPVGDSYEATAARVVEALGPATIGVEADHLSLGRFAALGREPGVASRACRQVTGLVERLRLVKDAWEVARLREAGGRLAEVAACILPKVSMGCTDRQVAWEIDQALHAAGFEKPAFDTIVASGPESARPHHRPSARCLGDGDLVVVDFGGILDGYAVDMTRTVALGAVPAEHRRWRRAVFEAQQAAIQAARPGAPPSAVDAAARASLATSGLDEYFVHSTGHGLGLEVHEKPTIGPRGDHDGPLAPGMVFTVEPGVYVPGIGGVRIEDDVVVAATGVECLTGAPQPFETHEF
jgi:Xaa-Pro aminopeptidase